MLWEVIISDDDDEETHSPVKLNVPNERMKKRTRIYSDDGVEEEEE